MKRLFLDWPRCWLVAIAIMPCTAQAGLDDLSMSKMSAGRCPLSVAALDQRQFVLKEGYAESQVGAYMQGIFRIRRKTTTDSGRSIADDLSEGLRKYFEGQGWPSVTAISTRATEPQQDVLDKIRRSRSPRAIYVTINDLWAESYRNTTVNYDFTVTVLDDMARVVSEGSFKGVHDTSEWGADAAAEVFSKEMTALLARIDFAEGLIQCDSNVDGSSRRPYGAVQTDVEHQLADLKRFFDKGLISKDVYEARQKSLLDAASRR